MRLLRATAEFVLAALLSSAAVASPFSSLVIFGDSLSDVGNIAQATGGIYPGSTYYNNRFSNGPVYAESLSTGLSLGPVTASTAGGNDFAYGGAQTTGTGGFNGAFIKDLDEQVDQFLASRTIDSHALYEVFTGANDFINGQTNVSVPAGVIAAQINRLVAAGATQFFVPNLPLLGDTPEFNGTPSTKAQYNLLTTQFNANLATTLDSLQTQNPALTFFRLDVASLFQNVISNPAQFGVTNVTASAAPGLTPGTLFYNKSKIVPDPNQYVFWDDVHPTATVHAILAQDALGLLALPGDYNHDGVVDAADYTVWRGTLGQTGLGLPADGDGDGVVDAADLRVWNRYFGDRLANGAGASQTVPEAPSWRLLLIGACAAIVLVRSA